MLVLTLFPNARAYTGASSASARACRLLLPISSLLLLYVLSPARALPVGVRRRESGRAGVRVFTGVFRSCFHLFSLRCGRAYYFFVFLTFALMLYRERSR